MDELFPELKNLKGGKKQAWINEHLDVIAALSDSIPFDRLTEILHMKPETLSAALAKAEGDHKPIITKADKATSRVALVDRKANEITKKVHGIAEAFIQYVEKDERRWNNMTRYFIVQSNLNELMAQVMLNEETTDYTRDLTYRI